MAETDRYELALDHGVRDVSYTTVRQGYIASYRDDAVITADGQLCWAHGHGTEGNEWTVRKRGYISFTPIEPASDDFVQRVHDHTAYSLDELSADVLAVAQYIKEKYSPPYQQDGAGYNDSTCVGPAVALASEMLEGISYQTASRIYYCGNDDRTGGRRGPIIPPPPIQIRH